MEIIKDVEELVGKTIKKAKYVSSDETLALLFKDKTCAFFGVKFYGESYDIEIEDDVEDYVKKEAGVISEEEYEEIQRTERVLNTKRQEESEREMLARLKSKYE